MKVIDDTICFNCGDRGHISRMCSKLKEFPQKKDKAMMATWGESDSDEEQERTSGCFMAEKEVMSLSQCPKNELIDLIMELKLCLDKHDELMEKKDMIISNITEENDKWVEKAIRLESQIANVPSRDKTLKAKNLKSKDEICMLKTENLKLVIDLKDACVSDNEKKKAWKKRLYILRLHKKLNIMRRDLCLNTGF